MNYAELTPTGVNRYDGSMSAGGSPVPENSPFQPNQPEARPTRSSDAVRSVQDSEIVDKEGENEPGYADSERKFRESNQELVNARRTTREHLGALVKQLRSPGGQTDILAPAEQVLYAARVLQKNKAKLASGDSANKTNELKDIDPDELVKQAEDLVNRITRERARGRARGDQEAQRAAAAQMSDSILGKAGEVAALAENLKKYFVREKIAPQELDPYKPIVSFEELMTKWVDVAEKKFRPGEEFALIDVDRQVDDFGREILLETARPENFMRWAQEKIWFYHDFDPYKPIELFKNLYLTVGFRTVAVYEMLVDVPTYFYHRKPTLGDMDPLERGEIERAAAMKTFTWAEGGQQARQDGDTVGQYRIFNKQTNKYDIYSVKLRIVETARGPLDVYQVLDQDGKPPQAILKDKDQWDTVEDPRFEKIKDEMLYEVWILNEAHNHDVAYRQQGMPTETELKKVMAEIYSMNMYTKNRKRLYKVLNMPAIRRNAEISAFMDGEISYQGSMGKGVQRALAAYYHISEGNAAAAGYRGVGEFNPFKEMLQKGEINGSDIFYKSLIKQTLQNHFGYEFTDFGEKGYKNNKVAVDLWNEVNKGRNDWDKADLMDVVALGGEELEDALQERGITQEDFANAVKRLRAMYQDGNKKRGIDTQPEKLTELDRLLGQTTQQKKEDVFGTIGGTLGHKVKSGDYDRQEGWVGKFLEGKGYANLDEFSVKFFTLAFDSWGTSTANVYENINYDLVARDIVKQAMRDAIQVTEKLDDFEAKYAEEYAFVLTYITGISARNDMPGIGHDAWSKMINTKHYRERQASGGNYTGNLDNLYGINRLSLNFFEGIPVQAGNSGKLNKTMYEVLVGQHQNADGSYSFDINKDIEVFDFHGNAMRQFYADHLYHVFDLFTDITQKHEFNTNDLLKEDGRGRITINHGEMQKMIDSTWKHMRYGFDNRHILYDNVVYNWWTDENLVLDESDREHPKIGQVKRTPHFGFKTIRDLMFSEKVQAMDMYKRFDVSSWSGSEAEQNKMGRNVLAFLIMAQIEEHTKNSGEATLYNADQVSMIADAFVKYVGRVMEGEDGEAIVLSGFYNTEEMTRMLLFANAMLWKLYSKEYGADATGGFFAALLQMFSIIMKEAGAGITLKAG